MAPLGTAAGRRPALSLINLPKLLRWNPEWCVSLPVRPWARTEESVLKTMLSSWWETDWLLKYSMYPQAVGFFLRILVLQSFCLLCKGNGFWNLFTFLPVDVRSWQIPPKSQEATGLRSKGLLGSTGKTDFSHENCFHLVFPMLSLWA